MLSFVVAGLACRVRRALLCRVCLDGPRRGVRLHLCLRHPGRVDGLDHRLGPRVGIRRRLGHGGVGLVALLLDVHRLLRLADKTGVQLAAVRLRPGDGKFPATKAYFDLPAVLITFAITTVLVRGIKESTTFNAVMVIIKLAIVLFVIFVGMWYIDIANWTPFAPFGYTGISFFGNRVAGQVGKGGEPLGMLAGASTIFFAYIGFDAVSNQSEEAKNPQAGRADRDHRLPDPLHGALHRRGRRADRDGPVRQDRHQRPDLHRVRPGRPALGEVPDLGRGPDGITSVLLVMMLSQPRVLLAMAPRRPGPAELLRLDPPEVQDPLEVDDRQRLLRGAAGRAAPAPDPRRAGEYRHPARLRHRLRGRPRDAPDPPQHRATLPGPTRPPAADPGDRHLPAPDVLPPLGELAPLIVWLAIGFLIYFGYGKYHSVMAKKIAGTPDGLN